MTAEIVPFPGIIPVAYLVVASPSDTVRRDPGDRLRDLVSGLYANTYTIISKQQI